MNSAKLFSYDNTVPSPRWLHNDPGAPLTEGQTVAGRYRVGRLIGAGGMALVFEGEHVELGSRVAIKVIRPQLLSDSDIAKRFVNEARGVAALNNPHVARVFDAGQLESGEPFLVMERLFGRTLLSQLRQSGPVSCAQAASFVLQACVGLADAHASGLIHRDIKPEHLFIVETPDAEPFVKVLDFGISKRLGGTMEGRVTNPGDQIGSPCYMSPEQMQDPAHVDQRTDVWSLGVVLYEAVTGARPFDGDTLGQIQWNVLVESPRTLSQSQPNTPAAYQQIVDRCLAKNREDRYPSVTELANALRRFLCTHYPDADRPAPSSKDWESTPPRSREIEGESVRVPGGSNAIATSEVPEVPHGRGLLRFLILCSVTASVGVVLWAWATGRVLYWTALNQSPSGQNSAVARPWDPPVQRLVKVEYGDTRTTSAEARPDDARGEEVAKPGNERAKPGASHPDRAGALTRAGKEARYRRWLESQGLTPVDEVMVKTVRGNGE